MFAEFEREAHAMAERGEALTAESLNAVYAKLNAAYYPQVRQDALIAYEWMRIPHFYNAFYVYKYATGFSAAMALAEGIRTEGAAAVERYKKFLSSAPACRPWRRCVWPGWTWKSPRPWIARWTPSTRWWRSTRN